jgi:hypothetical protein
VSNIVVNSIWYNAHFPHPESADDDDDDDHILIKAIGSLSLTRAKSSSLHGLIAILRADRGFTEQEAVACLCTNRRNVSQLAMTMKSSLNHHSLAAAAEAAKHPQPAALVAFLMTPEKHDHLRSFLMAKHALSNADFTELNTTITGNDVAAAPEKRMATTLNTMHAATPFPLISFKKVPATPVQRMATLDSGNPTMNTVSATMQTMTTPGLFQPGIFNAVSPTTVQRVSFGSPFQPGIFNTVPAAPVQRMYHDRHRPQSYIRIRVEEVLLDYGRNTPQVKNIHTLFSYLSVTLYGWSSSLLVYSILLV